MKRFGNALTCYSNPKWPQILGLHDFEGDLVHNAAWPEKFKYSGKKVAVIGNGSSGVQIVPALQPGENARTFSLKEMRLTHSDVKELVHFVRSPTWAAPTLPQLWKDKIVIPPKILQDLETDGDKFTPNQLEKFKTSPEYYLAFVKSLEEQHNSRFKSVCLQALNSLYRTTVLQLLTSRSSY